MLISKLKSCHFLLILLLAFFSTAAQADKKIIVFGDSLSAAYGIAPEQGWVNLLSVYLNQRHSDLTVINASISGETTDSGLSRLPSVIHRYNPNINMMIIALGANDGLRGLEPDLIQSNLGKMIALCHENKIQVLLVGMQIPPNYGKAYTQAIQKIYGDLSIKYQVRRIPFMLANVATHATLMQEDGLHPTAEAQPIILNTILMGLKPLLPKL